MRQIGAIFTTNIKMALIVHKYGGTSMGSVERIQNVAKRVAKWMKAGHQVVVVPSAMSGETNRLLGLAKEINSNPDPRELDQIASTGEQVSSGLLALALQSQGVPAVSYAGWQVVIKTDSAYTKARIQGIDGEKVHKDLDAGKAAQPVRAPVHPAHGGAYTVHIAHIANVELQLGAVVLLAHVVLLLLVAAEDADFLDVGVKEAFEDGVTE